MKKITLIMFFACFTFLSWGQSWCGDSYMTVNGTWYTGSNSYLQPAGYFNGADLGTFASSSSITLGGELQVWPSTTDTETMYYKIDDAASFTAIALPKTEDAGNNSKHYGTGSVSLSSLAAGAHTITVYFQAGSQYDSNNSANYIANFTVSVSTGLNNSTESVNISSANNQISAAFNGSAQVELYNYAGQLITKTNAENQFKQSVNAGLYILKINGQTYKLMVR